MALVVHSDLLIEELVPSPEPWEVARRFAHRPHLLFLDSSEHHATRGRYSYVMADPSEWTMDPETVFARLRDPFPARESQETDGLPPFRGGYAGHLSFELFRCFERIPDRRRNEFEIPEISLGRYDWVVAFDHQEHRAWLFAHGLSGERIDAIRSILIQPPQALSRSLALRSRTADELSPLFDTPFEGVRSNFSRDQFISTVRKAIDYIHAGDIFQVNLAQRLLAPQRHHALDIYERLRSRSPSPYGGYFDLGEFQILSASPEQFLKVTQDGEVITRPIKGTRPRGRSERADQDYLHDLMTNPKDRAENVMIVDLLRNDLGRVCEYGSVRVPVVCAPESYNYVHHLVSEVRGRLRDRLSPYDLIHATFPGGSITGAPKVRAMEIIAELEPTVRGPYCGNLFLLDFDGSFESNILIRTMTAGRGWIQYPVGAGIVADSIAEREYEETLHKAAGPLRALTP